MATAPPPAAPAASPAGQEEAPVKKGPGIIVWLLAAVVSGGIGFAVPMFVPIGGSSQSGAHEGEPAEEEHADASSHGGGHGDAHGGGHGGTTKPNSTVAFVNFGDIVVNLDEGKLNRYLRLRIMLQVKPKDEAQVTEAIEIQRVVLKNWLLSFLSDKELADIRGAAGQGMLRREIQEYFNTTLFPDGKDRIYDVLFDEFNIQ